MNFPIPNFEYNFGAFFGVFILVWLLAMAYNICRAVMAYRRRPLKRDEDIVYQEWAASGFSEASLRTRLGGANNCLRLIVTRDTLIVTTWAPLVIFGEMYDLAHVIPLASLEPIEVKKVMFHKFFRLTFRGSDGSISKICLAPKDPAAFLKAIRSRERAVV